MRPCTRVSGYVCAWWAHARHDGSQAARVNIVPIKDFEAIRCSAGQPHKSNLASRPIGRPWLFAAVNSAACAPAHMISSSAPAWLGASNNNIVDHPQDAILLPSAPSSLGDMKFVAKVSATSRTCSFPYLKSRFGPDHSHSQILHKFNLRSILRRIHDSAGFSLA